MYLRKVVAQSAVATALVAGALGAGPVTAPANADPDWQPGWGQNEWVDQHFGDRDWNQWWRVNRWRGDDRPPWGWGPPPPVHWRGHPPPVYDYWGYKVRPIWHPGFGVFGFWVFGIFVPIFVI